MSENEKAFELASENLRRAEFIKELLHDVLVGRTVRVNGGNNSFDGLLTRLNDHVFCVSEKAEEPDAEQGLAFSNRRQCVFRVDNVYAIEMLGIDVPGTTIKIRVRPATRSEGGGTMAIKLIREKMPLCFSVGPLDVQVSDDEVIHIPKYHRYLRWYVYDRDEWVAGIKVPLIARVCKEIRQKRIKPYPNHQYIITPPLSISDEDDAKLREIYG